MGGFDGGLGGRFQYGTVLLGPICDALIGRIKSYIESYSGTRIASNHAGSHVSILPTRYRISQQKLLKYDVL